MLLVTVMCLLKVDGKPLLRFKTMVDSGVTWGIILILAVVMPLSHAMANDESGITKFLMALMTPFFGNESSLVFALCMGFFATVLTQFMNNGATGIALMPVVYSYCTGMNVPPELAIIMVVMGVHIAFLTPAASASASLLHGNEWSNTKAIWRTVPIVILATWATISAIVVALGVALFQGFTGAPLPRQTSSPRIISKDKKGIHETGIFSCIPGNQLRRDEICAAGASSIQTKA